MTRRQRLERRLERRQTWAESRDRKAEQGFAKADTIASGIPLGQPILVGHHSEGRHRRDLDRIDAGMRQGVEASKMAEHHRSKADGIRHQLDSSIFSDDPDAPERLRERIADLEAQRARIVAYNKTARKAAKAGEPHGDLTILDDDQRRDLLTILRVCPYQSGPGLPMPAYKLSNLSGNTRRLRLRLQAIEFVNATEANQGTA